MPMATFSDPSLAAQPSLAFWVQLVIPCPSALDLGVVGLATGLGGSRYKSHGPNLYLSNAGFFAGTRRWRIKSFPEITKDRYLF